MSDRPTHEVYRAKRTNMSVQACRSSCPGNWIREVTWPDTRSTSAWPKATRCASPPWSTSRQHMAATNTSMPADESFSTSRAFSIFLAVAASSALLALSPPFFASALFLACLLPAESSSFFSSTGASALSFSCAVVTSPQSAMTLALTLSKKKKLTTWKQSSRPLNWAPWRISTKPSSAQSSSVFALTFSRAGCDVSSVTFCTGRSFVACLTNAMPLTPRANGTSSGTSSVLILGASAISTEAGLKGQAARVLAFVGHRRFP
mmetsp:Transcript_91857/g.237035  ORF Transcript_91857/g.237035 Transcript_91857/m.237035 type:complete len:262 (+) Transcript_91857:351-1136(+)